jgi:hypothetical protein
MTTSPPPETMPRAQGVRLFTHSSITAPWLAGAVSPVVRGLHDAGVPLLRLRRGWLGGPHVDVLAARPPTEGWAAVTDALAPGPRPSDGMTPQAYLDQARALGALENVPPPYLPFRDHGTTEVLDAGDVALRNTRLDALGDVAVVEAGLCVPVLDTVDAVVGDPSTATAVLAEAFAALGDTHYLGIGHSAFAFRSHLEAFLARCRPEQAHQLRERFAERRQQDGATVRRVVEDRLAGRVGPVAGAWRTAFAYGAGTLDRAAARGELDLEMLDRQVRDDAVAGRPSRYGNGYPETPFHRAVAASGSIDAPDPWFAAYRLLVNVFYRQLPLLGVAPLTRYYLCSAVAEAVDEVLGESWEQRLVRRRVRVVDPA